MHSPTTVQTTFGALLVGALFASVIYGISSLQATFYFRSYRNDPMRLKVLVAVIWVLDTIHTGFVWGAVWFYLIGQYDDVGSMDYISWEIPMVIIQSALIVICVHCFFAHRIFMLSRRSWLLSAPVIILVCLRLASCAVLSAKLFEYKLFTTVQAHDGWLFTLGLASSAVLDVYTSSVLAYLLLRHRGESDRINHVLYKLVIYGSLTTLGSTTTILCWVIMSNNMIFLGLYFCTTKLYASVVFATLNSRYNILREPEERQAGAGGGPILFRRRDKNDSGDPVQFASQNRSTKVPVRFGASVPASASECTQDFQISVQMERTVHYDDGSMRSVE
ncbi:hypothetical protein FB45DRAFT_839480 [Roridomyces roridus]|uniref:DUF6534 domain-containing protein n=1 Tax=Roridomyces roridus TaxID=1738132 RepID=A0AAD7BGJ3_9AGAR|nr:hypothetical protein FB45DRAFT_839480 [Roridomyces roridus]